MHLEDASAMAATGRSVARFDAHPSAFRLELQGCPTPGCPCSDGTVAVVELAADPAAALVFQVVVELRSGAPADGPPRPPAVEGVAQELVRDLPAAVREGALERLRARRARELDGFALPAAWVGQPGLWPFSHLFRGGVPDEPQYRGLLDRHRDDEGRRWAVQDLYCPIPGCDCREVTLSFDADDGATFVVVVPLGAGPGRVEDPRGLPAERATAVFRAWSDGSERADRKRFAARYRALREAIAANALQRATQRPPPAARPAAPPPPAGPGPNTPCPCGSGRKYKRCHGAAA